MLFSNNYKSFWNCAKTKGEYSGVCVFSKITPLNITYGININEHDNEGRVITLEYNDFYLVCVYVPNSGEALKRLDYRINKWDLAFYEYLENLSKIKDIIVAGDLNVAHQEIDLCNPKSNLKSPGFTLEERNSFSKFLKKGFIDTFRHLHKLQIKYSFFSNRFNGNRNYLNNKGWRLDYFLVNKDSINRVFESDILKEYQGSDHVPIKLEYKYNKK